MKKQILTLFILLSICQIYAQNWSPVGDGVSTGLGSALFSLHSYDDKLFVGGDFSAVDNVTSTGIAFWDNQRWKSFVLDQLPYSRINSFTVYNGELYGFGRGVPSEIVKFDKDENTWIPVPNSKILFVSGEQQTNFGFGEVNQAIEYDGHLYVTGRFTLVGENVYECYFEKPMNNIAKWDGNEWTAVINETIDGIQVHRITDLAVFNGELIICGEIQNLEGELISTIFSWNGNNWKDLASQLFDPFSHLNLTSNISQLEVFEGELYAAGRGASIIGDPNIYALIKWDGETWKGINGYERTETSIDHENRITALKTFNKYLVIGQSNEGETHFFDGSIIKKLEQNLEAPIVKFEEYKKQLYAVGPIDLGPSLRGIVKLDFIEGTAIEFGDFQLAPNPTQGLFRMEYTLEERSKVTVEIYNSIGQLIERNVTNELAGRYIKGFDLKGLSSGTYIVCLTAKGINTCKVFLKTE